MSSAAQATRKHAFMGEKMDGMSQHVVTWFTKKIILTCEQKICSFSLLGNESTCENNVSC